MGQASQRKKQRKHATKEHPPNNDSLSMLSRQDQIKALNLLNHGPASFTHTFEPAPEFLHVCSKIILSAFGSLTTVEILPPEQP